MRMEEGSIVFLMEIKNMPSNAPVVKNPPAISQFLLARPSSNDEVE